MDSEGNENKSRSQLKREFQEVKELVQQLVERPASLLRNAPLSERILDSVLAAQELERYPLKRQVGYIAGQLREDDIATIRAIVSGEWQPESADVEVPPGERWGIELIAGDDRALSDFVDRHPGVDRQRLRQLVRNAKKERDADGSRASAAQLFEYLETLSLED